MILHTEVLGDGEPIVFLHTGLQTGLTDFESQRDYFKDKYKVILPDLRGHGESITDDLTNFFEDSAKDIADTLNNLEVDSAHIVGCSLGALVGLSFAKRFTKKTKSLTISGVMFEKPNNWLELHKQDMERQEQLMKNDEIVGFFNNLHKSNWKESLEIAKDENWYPFEITKDLEDITSPILFMVGEGNKTETKGALFYPSIKDDVHVSIIPFASHLVHSEQPDIYTKILEKFINKVNN
ncbi:alpha/beta fold hydrolase [Saliterribacillus persicus]|uniref:Pimeloyl-ACP methyl ester carboxylesterase n=1 Tax=Saliterribacillus persicus TaxID=930114 RepID=A0A368Y9Q6_9BACI|nr:alpha/beta hydrolase [Saliterribacillus persicus]RCW76942.1 pimeloyl-ACP methyl ester carboxylesterase [Saliterribacillus persicus]